MADLIQLIKSADIVTRALVNLEGDRQTPHVPKGWKVITPKHPERVMGEVVRQVAWPRFLIWWLYLQSQHPTRASFEHAVHQARERLARRVTRAAGDNPDDANNMPLTDEEKALIIGDIAESLVMSDWLGGTDDAETLQALETYWAQLAGQLAGQQFLDAAGITGSFNLYDSRFFDYILKNTGALVTRIDATTREQLSRELYKLLGGTPGQASLGMGSLAPKLMQSMWDTYDNALADMSLKRAMMIALTETARAEEFGNFVSMLQMGVQQKIWVITAGACIYCEADAEQGPIPILEQFPSGNMTAPGHPKCFPAGTIVSGPRAIASTTRWYEGRLVEVRTCRGHFLSTTPNHPILTTNGWVAAGLLKKGDKVVCGPMSKSSSCLPEINPDEYQVPSLIENVASAIGSTSSMASRSMITSAKDFHGDGIEDQVCVIRTNRLLGNSGNTSLLQPDLQQLFGRGNVMRIPFISLGDTTLLFKRMLDSVNRIMGSLRISPIFLLGSLGHQQPICLGLGAHRNILGHQETMYGSTGNAKMFAHLNLGHSTSVHVDKFSHVGRRPSTWNNNPSTFQMPLNNVSTTVKGLRNFFNSLARLISLGHIDGIDMKALIMGDHRMVRDIIIPQCFADSICTDTKPDNDAFGRFSGSISMDDIVDISTRDFAGHVYNLETSTGWYIANDSIAQNCTDSGIVVHNCRCTTCSALLESYDPSQWTPNPDLANALLDNPDIAFWPQMPESLRLSVPHTIRADISQERVNQVGEAALSLAEAMGKSIPVDMSVGIDDVIRQFQDARPTISHLTSHEQHLVAQFNHAIQ